MLTLSEFVNDNIVFENLQAQNQNLQAQNQETLLTLLYENSVAHLLISQEIFSQCINTEGVQTTNWHRNQRTEVLYCRTVSQM